LCLIDPDPDSEARRNILVTPFWNSGDETFSLTTELEQQLALGRLSLPAKFGFAIDCAVTRTLAGASADIRIERDSAGGLLVRADGLQTGRPVMRTEAVKVALALADWFVDSGGTRDGRGRMAAHIAAGATLPDALHGHAEPARVLDVPQPGLSPYGAMVGVAFGQLTCDVLGDLAGHAQALRLTPWRMILAEGLREMPDNKSLITNPDNPMLRVIACSGAPACRDAHADTRTLAAALAPYLPADARLHVSGCAKGCAQSAPASITLIATSSGFDLVRGGSTRDAPALRGLSCASMVANPSALVGEG
jgi:precorrin-3B synthase